MQPTSTIRTVVPHFTTNKAERYFDMKRKCGQTKLLSVHPLGPRPPNSLPCSHQSRTTMSRIADVVQTSSIDRRISQGLQCIPCGRCYAVIEYDQGAEWCVVSKLVNEHWKACPGKPHAWPTRMACTPTSPPDTTIALPPSVSLKEHSGPFAESVGSPNNTWISPGCERKRRTLEQRKWELEQDEYAKNITMKSVVCGGCHKEISLDKRSKYYPGLWLKHRGKCPSIEKLEVSNIQARKLGNVLTPLKRAKVKVPHQQGLDGTRQGPYDVVIPTSGGHSHGDVAPLGSAEGYENHSGATTQQLVRYYDSENLSSEDEDEDGDLLPHEPFPSESIVLHEYTPH